MPIKKYVADLSAEKQKELATTLGMSLKMIQYVAKGERFLHRKHTNKVADFFGISKERATLEMAGESFATLTETSKLTARGEVVKKTQVKDLNRHIDVISKFKNKELARKVNMDLVEIEEINPEEFRDLCSEIRGMLIILKKEKKREARRERVLANSK